MQSRFRLMLMCLIVPVAANANTLSAYRPLDKDYRVYEARALQESSETNFLGRSAISSARLYSEATLSKAVGWRTVQDMQERFELIRDTRFLSLNSDPSFPRRISWLYPKDGCFARASLFNRQAFRMFIPIPNKIFAFGNLRVKTPNSPRGVVGWWYHVAPMVKVGETGYVLDPAIEPLRPLPVLEWLSRMGRPERIKVAVCSSGTYSPGDSCARETDGMELRAERTQKHYLMLEERELRRMGRNPELELGEGPPWRGM